MLGKRSAQSQLFDVGNVYPLSLSASSFHGQLAKAASHLFKDEDFAAIYCDKYGRPGVAPSLLALATILQHQAKVSDEEAIDRTTYDMRWAVVLGRPAGEPLCAKSTLQLFRAHLILHEEVRVIFLSSILEAKRAGLLKGKAFRVALDTKPIDGRGAVLDTYNLLASGIRQLAEALAKSERRKPLDFMRSHDLGLYTESSVKGAADIDWSDPKAKDALLTRIVADAKRLLGMVDGSNPAVREASLLLQKLLLQDVQETISSDGEALAQIKKGTAPNRIPSATDPEQRHGRKSKSKRFVGSKASIAVDIDSQIILATDVLPGNAGDAEGALELVEQAEANSETPVSESLTDCAYGGGETRQAFADAGRILIAKVPKEAEPDGLFAKSAFTIDLEADTVTCPAGNMITRFTTLVDGGKRFNFGRLCRGCPLRASCTRSSRGRTIKVHPQEALIRKARKYQATPEGRKHMRERVVVEHRLARLGQLEIGQARYIGTAKTQFQLMMAAAIANYQRTWNWEDAKRKAEEIAAQSVLPILAKIQTTCLEAIRRFLAIRPRPEAIAA